MDRPPAETHPVAGLQGQSVSSRCAGGDAGARPSRRRLEDRTKLNNADSYVAVGKHFCLNTRKQLATVLMLPFLVLKRATTSHTKPKAAGRITDDKMSNAKSQYVQ